MYERAVSKSKLDAVRCRGPAALSRSRNRQKDLRGEVESAESAENLFSPEILRVLRVSAVIFSTSDRACRG